MSVQKIIAKLAKEDDRYFTSVNYGCVSEQLCYRKAKYESLKRMVSCLVNERIVKGFLHRGEYDGIKRNTAILRHSDFFEDKPAIYMNLLAEPVIDQGSQRITLLDPNECGPTMMTDTSVMIDDALSLFLLISRWNNFDCETSRAFCNEVANSTECQSYAYKFPPINPTLSSRLIEWEQSVIEGHATHPMHRSRYSESPMAKVLPSTNIFDATINFIAVKRKFVTICGDFEDVMTNLLKSLNINNWKEATPDDDDYVILPIHSLQLPNVFLHFHDHVRLLSFTTSAVAQASLRTLDIPAFPSYSVKLPLGIVTTSSKRTITPWTAYIGSGLKPILDIIVEDKKRLIVVHELSSAFSSHPDFGIAKHLAVVFRESINHLSSGKNEITIPCMALTELNPEGLPRVVEIFDLRSVEQKTTWFKEYASTLMEVLIPPLVKYGFSFEGHGQNMLVRIDSDTREIKGFYVRDFGGIKCHQETLSRTIGHTVKTIRAGGFCEAKTLDSVNVVAYHTLIQCHLNRFIRALGLHYNFEGWRIVRNVLLSISQQLPRESPNYQVFDQWLLNPTAKLKCFIRMKLDALERDYIYEDVPNLLYQ